METTIKQKRDGRLDCIKGISISLVVVGHILQYCYIDYSSTLLFNIIWTLQIPLFVVVSGFFAWGGEFTVEQFIKKIRNYLIPFISCFLISELFIRGNTDLLSRFVYLAYHLESSLWYLFVLFLLSLIHMVAVTIVIKTYKSKIDTIGKIIVYSIVYVVCLLPFGCLAIAMGTSFLGSKFVLYYSLFFWMGFVWKTVSGIIVDRNEQVKLQIEGLQNIIVVMAFIAYFVLISRFNIAESGDRLHEIVIRFTASVCGIILVIKTVYSVYNENNQCSKFFAYLGNYTLEIYYIHYLFIPFFTNIAYPISTPMGMMSIVFLYFVVLALCAIGIMVTKSSSQLSLLLFGRSRK